MKRLKVYDTICVEADIEVYPDQIVDYVKKCDNKTFKQELFDALMADEDVDHGGLMFGAPQGDSMRDDMKLKALRRIAAGMSLRQVWAMESKLKQSPLSTNHE